MDLVHAKVATVGSCESGWTRGLPGRKDYVPADSPYLIYTLLFLPCSATFYPYVLPQVGVFGGEIPLSVEGFGDVLPPAPTEGIRRRACKPYVHALSMPFELKVCGDVFPSQLEAFKNVLLLRQDVFGDEPV